MTATAMAQYSLMSYWLKPGAKPMRIYLAQPIVFGVGVGILFGIYENMCYPKVVSPEYLQSLREEKERMKEEAMSKKPKDSK